MRTRRSFHIPTALLAAFVLVALGVGETASAQCATCAQPTVAYSPVVQTAYSPVVQTTVAPRVGWYPGKWIRRAFGWGDPVTTTAYTTAAYQPTYPPSYNVGYAPSTYTVGYAPTAYAASYAPSAYTVGYAPTSYSVGYAPTSYTVGYAAPACSSCGCNPCSCQTSYRPVTLSPVCDACNTCSTGCSACSGVAQAGYSYAPSSSCPSCASGVGQVQYEASPSNNGYYGEQTPQPAVPPGANVPEQRQSNYPESESPEGEKSLMGEESSYTPFLAPPLINPVDQTTRRPTAPVWTAVYHKDANVHSASMTVNKPVAQPKHRTLDASNWSSAR